MEHGPTTTSSRGSSRRRMRCTEARPATTEAAALRRLRIEQLLARRQFGQPAQFHQGAHVLAAGQAVLARTVAEQQAHQLPLAHQVADLGRRDEPVGEQPRGRGLAQAGADDDEAGPEASSVAIDIFCREASVGVSAAAAIASNIV